MRLEEYENWDDKRLRDTINACFEHAMEIDGDDRRVVLVEAEFYLKELDRRENRRVNAERQNADARRDLLETRRRRIDLRLEVLVVSLIGLELIVAIGLAIWGGRQQTKDVERELKAFGDMQVVLSHLQDSSKATAETMIELKTNSEGTNIALQKQLALFYEVSVNVIFDSAKKELQITNNGRTNVTLWGDKFGDTPRMAKNGMAIPPTGALTADATLVYDSLIVQFPKPSTGFIPYELYIKNDRGEKFVQVSHIGILWQGDIPTIIVQSASVAPGHWPPGTSQNPAFKKAP